MPNVLRDCTVQHALDCSQRLTRTLPHQATVRVKLKRGHLIDRVALRRHVYFPHRNICTLAYSEEQLNSQKLSSELST